MQDDLIKVPCLMRKEYNPKVSGLKCISNNKATFAWFMIQATLCVGKDLSWQDWLFCHNAFVVATWRRLLSMPFFIVQSYNNCANLFKVIYFACSRGSFFVLEVCFVCQNVGLLIVTNKQYVFLCSLAKMRVVIWLMQKKFHAYLSSSL